MDLTKLIESSQIRISFQKAGAASAANGAHVPWIGLFDPAITDGAQHGFYIVYLFSADMERVYLSVNQGTTEVQAELGSGEETFDELRSRAAIMRERAPEFRKRLNAKKIDLASDKFFPRGYEAGHAFGREYKIASPPAENILLDDLKEAIRLYRISFFAVAAPFYRTKMRPIPISEVPVSQRNVFTWRIEKLNAIQRPLKRLRKYTAICAKYAVLILE